MKGRLFETRSEGSFHIIAALPLAQHHGWSYQHLAPEIASKLLASWQVIEIARSARSDMKFAIVEEESGIARNNLRLFGFPKEKVDVAFLKRSAFSPILLSSFLSLMTDMRSAVLVMPLRIVDSSTGKRLLSLGGATGSNSEKVRVVLVKREKGRIKDRRGRKRCHGNRWLLNFHELR